MMRENIAVKKKKCINTFILHIMYSSRLATSQTAKNRVYVFINIILKNMYFEAGFIDNEIDRYIIVILLII